MEKVIKIIPRLQCLLIRPTVLASSRRCISLTRSNYLKEIQLTEGEKTTVIEGVYVESPRKDYLLPQNDGECCYLCKLNLDIQHTDVLILSQFVKDDGTMLSQRVTGLCGTQQLIIENLIKQAIHAGLMPTHNQSRTYEDPRRRLKHKRCNRYFTGDSIKDKAHEYY